MKLEVLGKDRVYHIYNRGINSEVIFNSDENKRYFLKLYSKHLENKAETFAYCLMDNHFHFIIRIVNENEIIQGLSNLFNKSAVEIGAHKLNVSFSPTSTKIGSMFNCFAASLT